MIKRWHMLLAAVFLAALFYWLIEGGGILPSAPRAASPLLPTIHMLLAAVFLAALFYWLVEGGDILPAATRATSPLLPTITGGTLSEEKDGKKNWLFNVQQIQMDMKNQQSLLTGIDGKIYRPGGGVIEVTAQSGLYNQKTKEVTLDGGVTARYSEGWTLGCQKMSWTPASDLVVASGKVEITKENLFIAGDLIESDHQLAKVKITGNGLVRKER